jgi:hypothetical protein
MFVDGGDVTGKPGRVERAYPKRGVAHSELPEILVVARYEIEGASRTVVSHQRSPAQVGVGRLVMRGRPLWSSPLALVVLVSDVSVSGLGARVISHFAMTLSTALEATADACQHSAGTVRVSDLT